jgi:hypothetical protein
VDPFPNANDEFGADIAVVGDFLLVAPQRGGDVLVFSQVPEPASLAILLTATITAAPVAARRGLSSKPLGSHPIVSLQTTLNPS